MNRLLGAVACLVFSTVAAHAQSYTFTTLAGSAPQSGSTDGAGSNARFNRPNALVVDGGGNLYVADRLNQTIRKITPAGTVSTLAGSPGLTGTTDGTGGSARFNSPTGLALDSAGNLFVADDANHTIRKITPAGVVSTFAGLGGTFGASDGTGSAARFTFPYGIAIDANDNLYVTDFGNRTIRKITSAGVVSTVAGLAGVSGISDGAGSVARFTGPEGITLDLAGNLVISDTSADTIRRLTPAGVVTTIAGVAGFAGSTNSIGTAASFNLPTGVAVDAGGNILVADVVNSAIRRIAPDGTVTTYAGSRGVPGSTDGTGTGARFFRPAGITIDAAGNAYVADTLNQTIRKITSALVTTTIAGAPGSYGSADGAGSTARFNAPRGLAIDSSGNVFVADAQNNTLRKISPAGVVSTFAGLAGSSGFNDGTGNAARFNFPTGLAIDGANKLFLSDESNDVVRTITPAGAVTTIAGGASLSGSSDGNGSAARFNFPRGLSVDQDGNTYVADLSNHTIRKIAPDGSVTTLAGSPGLSGSTDGVGSAARFNFPEAAAVDAAGNVYVADFGNSIIRKITPAGAVSTLAGLAGSAGSTDGNGANARFNGPEGLVIDSAGNLFIADTNNHAVRKITPAGTVTTVAGQSTQFGSADGTGTNALFFWPVALAIDGAGALYVLDNANNTVSKGVLDTAPAITAQPFTVSITPGSRLTLGVSATGGGLSYQWFLNGSLIPGATGSTYSVTGAQPASAGNYTVAVSNSVGALISTPAAVTVAASSDLGRLANLSILTQLVSGETMVMGTALGGGTSAKPLVVRAGGPALAAFGLGGLLPDPKISVFSIATSANIAKNDDWGGDSVLVSAFSQVGAFPFGAATSKDAGLFLPGLSPGNYTVQVSDAATGTGTVIAEIYDATTGAFTTSTSRLVNVSVLKQIAAGTSLTAGFVIGGSTAKTVLVRAVGPTLALAPFNLPSMMTDPKLELFNNATGAKITENNDWGGNPALVAAASSVGAFAFANTSTKDAALILTLPPGQYSARASAADGGGGQALIEVYEVP